jgi:carboxypeptidase C (cathepsin A)
MAEKNEDQKSQEKSPSETLQDRLVETHHQVVIQGRKIQYTVTTGTLILKAEVSAKKENQKDPPKDFEEPKAAIFFIAYTRDGVDDLQDRPITFSFNGGPGSSSVWLHLGLLGPRRVLMDEMGNSLPPPYRLAENEYSLLDVTDLVFIDPVTTGFSRAVPGEEDSQFHGFQSDIESVGDFIRLYTSRYRRWASPKFLIGESYGTTRAGGLSGYLQQRHGLFLNGIMLISAVLNFQTHDFAVGNDLPYITFLPSYAAAAWYHQSLPPDLQAKPLRELLDEVEDFAFQKYSPAMMRGASLTSAERQELVDQLSNYTGLSTDYIDRAELRINIFKFVKELLRSRKQTVGRLDTRFTGVDRDSSGETCEFDPSYSNIQGCYTAMLNHYLTGELGYSNDLPYEILSGRVSPWSYKEYENRFVDVSETLRSAMSQNPYLKVFIANGYFDLATPYHATEYTVNHLGLDPSLQANLQMSYFEAGHMMYIHLPSLQKMRGELVDFLASSLPTSK